MFHQLPKSNAELTAQRITNVGTACSNWFRTVEAWKQDGVKPGDLLDDIPLLRLAHGVVHHPKGKDRGILSIFIEHALPHGHRDVPLSRVQEYIIKFGLESPTLLSQNAVETALKAFQELWAAKDP
jgi:hypothetical protein